MKSKKRKKSKKIKLNLFRKVSRKHKKEEIALLFSVCLVVFGVSFIGIGKPLYDHNQEIIKSAFKSQPSVQIFQSAAAAEQIQSAKDNSLIEKEDLTAVSEEDILAKERADKAARAKAVARIRAARTARILSGPVPTGPTKGMPDGTRVCTSHSSHPQRGGQTHIDEDCCADYNEYPNPRCYYSPEKLAILKMR